ncbi:hypothetical protein PtA15_13A521 [Puccinia triticina]|uniref:Uncharacterized protein n=1 Tax=Puccinia triticina TaxID=208348 RepID=A0ABY7D1L4_9BASI|nr:uncharacterized protein PtA15_13A521 [Puccinia triticina]WAQ91120.1 hypothetical protein PtA15_13A521 [Puccinia triticina]
MAVKPLQQRVLSAPLPLILLSATKPRHLGHLLASRQLAVASDPLSLSPSLTVSPNHSGKSPALHSFL